MSMTLAVAHPGFGLIATDRWPEVDEGHDRLVPMRGSGWAVGTGSAGFVFGALPALRPVDARDRGAVSRQLAAVAERFPAQRESWITVVYHDGTRFVLDAYDATGALEEEESTKVHLSVTLPPAVPDDFSARFKEKWGGFVQGIRPETDPEAIMAAVGEHFAWTEGHTEGTTMGHRVEGTLIWPDGSGGFQHLTFTADPTEAA